MVSAATGMLTVIGDAQDNTIVVSRDAAGSILVNSGTVTVFGEPTVANTSLVQIFGLGGNDNLSLDESNGALPKGNIFGGDGNDVLIGGDGNDVIIGGAGNDTLTSGAGRRCGDRWARSGRPRRRNRRQHSDSGLSRIRNNIGTTDALASQALALVGE